jgi:uncharacterized protein (DUF1778 family)
MEVRPPAHEEDTATFPDHLLFMAMEDLDASVVLYDAGHYPQSVFLLQQAVEKAAKSFSIRFGIITEKDAALRIGHKPLTIARETTKTFTDGLRPLPKEPEALAHFSDLGFDLPKIVESVDLIESGINTYLNSIETFDLSEADARAIVATLKDTHVSTEQALKRLDTEGIPDAAYEQMVMRLEQTYRSFYASLDIPEAKKAELIEGIPEITREILGKKDQVESTLFMTLTLTEPLFLLFHLARATGPHAIKARYPDTRTGFDPLAYYTPDRPIIAALPDLHTHPGIGLERLDRLYDLIASPPEMADLTTTCDPRVTLPTHQAGHP